MRTSRDLEGRGPARASRDGRSPRRQSGVVLFIALIVLVAMTLAGIAMVRSIDTALGIAGNFAFRQSTVQGSDQGVQAAFNWLATTGGGNTILNSTDTSNGYFSLVAADPNWFDTSTSSIWNQSVTLNNGQPDAAGNVVQYIIHRMCNQAGPYGPGCALYYPNSSGTSGGSMSVGATQFQGIPMLYYRVTVRVLGPHNTASVTQTNVLISTT